MGRPCVSTLENREARSAWARPYRCEQNKWAVLPARQSNPIQSKVLGLLLEASTPPLRILPDILLLGRRQPPPSSPSPSPSPSVASLQRHWVGRRTKGRSRFERPAQPSVRSPTPPRPRAPPADAGRRRRPRRPGRWASTTTRSSASTAAPETTTSRRRTGSSPCVGTPTRTPPTRRRPRQSSSRSLRHTRLPAYLSFSFQ